MNQTDIVIVGGGIVGHVLAAGLLHHTRFSVTVIDANPAPSNHADNQRHPGFDARVIALARRTVAALNTMGIDTREARSEPIKTIQVSEHGATGLCHLSAAQFRLASFGEVTALSRLGRLLSEHNQQAGLHYLSCQTVVQAQQYQQHVSLTLTNGQTLTPKLLVLADGGRSTLAGQLNIERQQQPYEQVALVCNVIMSKPHNYCAYERFTPDGPLAFLPFNSGENDTGCGFSVVWTVAADKADYLQSLDKTGFTRALQRAFGFRHGSIRHIGKRASYPLALETAGSITSHRVALAGNAAQTLHPIAGQGFNLGLRDTLGLVNALAEAADPGAFTTLRAYSRAREHDRKDTIWLTDALVRGFSNRHGPLKIARNAGLIALDNSRMMQQAFVQRTTGFGPGM